VAIARRLAHDRPELGRALWWDLFTAQAALYERILSLGRRSAAERLGHLFCELHYRLDRVGMAKDGEFEMPVSQSDLGDLLGLSAVHVNRSLQELRLSGLLSLRDRRMQIHDLSTLADLSYFNPSYFHAGEDVLRTPGNGARP
jgi:CRP-like cAMP-binding protein